MSLLAHVDLAAVSEGLYETNVKGGEHYITIKNVCTIKWQNVLALLIKVWIKI